MRKVNRKRLEGLFIVAAGLETWIGGHAALAADYTLTWVNAHARIAAQDVWVLELQNTSGPDTLIGNGFGALDVNLSTPGMGKKGALFIDTTMDIDGDAMPDANVTDDPGLLGGLYPGLAPQPAVSESTGTFIGWDPISNASIDPITRHVKTPASPATNGSGQAQIYVNSQTYVNHTALIHGSPDYIANIPGAPAVYTTTESTDGTNTPPGSIDPAFTMGTVHSLELLSDRIEQNITVAMPIANVVVPTGTPITAIIQVGGTYSGAPAESYTLTTPALPAYLMLPGDGFTPGEGISTNPLLQDSTSKGAISYDSQFYYTLHDVGSVPEPGGLSLMVLGGLTLLRSARGRRAR